MLKVKAFIYRFSNIFGLHIFLAHKEQQQYLETIEIKSEFQKEVAIGLWQGKKGFTSVWTYNIPFHKAIIKKIKHAFHFKEYL